MSALDNYVLLGKSRLRVSPLSLGAMTFGDYWVVATKYTNSMLSPRNPNAGGNHRKNMMTSLDASLRRLNTDYIDQLKDNLGALDFTLDEEHMNALNEISSIDLGYPHGLIAGSAAVIDGEAEITPKITDLV